ncbi:MAG: GFA family protein [Comamonadaceae bacterium]|nr:MAG: GFA family protein [Comamonadaceae bacterium]
MDAKRVGGCLCGAVRYEVRGEITQETLCHCTSCRRANAAPVVAWFSVPPEAFRLTKGMLKSFSSSPGVVRSFCGECGTPITYQRDGLHELDVTTCSLDDPESAPPRDHTFVRSALAWAPVEDGLPRYPALRDEAEGSPPK